MRRTAYASLVTLLLAAACTSPEPVATTTTTTSTIPPVTTTSTTVPSQRPIEAGDLHLALVWQLHVPALPIDEGGVVPEPWARLGAVGDHHRLIAALDAHPDVQTTIAPSPSYLEQLQGLLDGRRDRHWVLTEIPADALTVEQRTAIVTEFLAADDETIDRFPRYRQIADRHASGATLTDADITDLQVLWNLAWIDPALLETGPLADLTARGTGFDADDKRTVLGAHLDIAGTVIEAMKALRDSGQAEIATSAFASPVIPLVADTALALEGDPAATVPTFGQVGDAVEQVERGVGVVERILDEPPTGMVPAGGAVTQLTMSLYSRAGAGWVASGERVLRASLGEGPGTFPRDPDGTVVAVDTLYRPWSTTLRRTPDIAMVFGDALLSDALERGYATLDADAAADHFVGRLAAIAARSGDVTPALVTVVVDDFSHLGADADGVDRLSALFAALDRSPIRTVTPSWFLAAGTGLGAIPVVAAASSPAASLSPWIGEPAETAAWRLLATARSRLATEARIRGTDDPAVTAATDLMLRAEASDWFAPLDDGPPLDAIAADAGLRSILARVYTALGIDPDPALEVPLVRAPRADPSTRAASDVTIVVDNEIIDAEWAGAARHDIDGALIETLYLGSDDAALYVRVDFTREVLGDDSVALSLYVGTTRSSRRGTSLDGQPLGFAADRVVEWRGSDPVGVLGPTLVPPAGSPERFADHQIRSVAGFTGEAIEFAIPWDALGTESGDDVALALVTTEAGAPNTIVPAGGPAAVRAPWPMPDDPLIEVLDPEGDDHGPGSYIYPEAIPAGTFDLLRFVAARDGDDLLLEFQMAGPVRDAGTPNPLGALTFDVYVDTDPAGGTGNRLLLPGRNAALGVAAGWDRAIVLDAWEPAAYVAGDGVISEVRIDPDIAVYEERGRVVARIPLTAIADSDPAGWAVAVAVLGHDRLALPESGRVRSVLPIASLDAFGGAPEASANHTRIIDLAWTEPEEQEAFLSAVALSPVEPTGPGDVATIPLLPLGQ